MIITNTKDNYMTNEEKSRRIAKFCGKDNLFVLKKRGLYYRPDGCGYTDNISEAWQLKEEDADKHTYPYDEPVTKHPAPIPDYFSDFGAILDAKNLLEPFQRMKFSNFLLDILGLDEESPIYHISFIVSNAPVAQQAEALGLACKLW